jgi:hypothetical protein
LKITSINNNNNNNNNNKYVDFDRTLSW